MEQQEHHNSSQGKKIILFGLCITAAGFLGLMGWEKYKKYKVTKSEENDPENFPLPPQKVFTPVNPPAVNKNVGFPLKQGSTGEQVKALQNMLIAKYGAAILGKYGADGKFGPSLSDVLKSKGLPTVIDENTFNVLVNPSSNLDAAGLAQKIYSATLTKKFAALLPLLQQLKSTKDYSVVSENFKNFRIGGVRQTLVNALMNLFSGDQKQKIQLEFTRIGLKFDGNKWSLSGIEFPVRIITTSPTVVWKDTQTAIKVPSNLILGYKLEDRNGFTAFKSINGGQFLVKTESIKYI
jgi:hypothetical protein